MRMRRKAVSSFICRAASRQDTRQSWLLS